MRERLVILDLGGTLVEGPSHGPATQIAQQIGLSREHKQKLYAALMSTPFTGPDAVAGFLRELTGDRSPAVRQAVADVWQAQEDAAAPIAGAREALEALHRAGGRFAVISNIWGPYLTSVRRHYPELFAEWVAPELQFFSCTEGHPKPSPVMFERALKAARIAPDRAVMIGDSYAEDIVPAAASGMRTIWLMHRPHREVDALVDVLNGKRPAPTRAVAAIDRIDAALIDGLG